MSSINFTTGTVIPSTWLNDVDTVVYTLFGNGTSLNSPSKLTINSVVTPLVQNAAGNFALNAQTGLGILQFAASNVYFWDSTSFRPVGDNIRDLGESANRFRTGYFGTSVVTPLVGTATASDFGLMVNGTTRWTIANAAPAFSPVGDNTQNIGTPTNRVGVVFTPIIDSGTTAPLILSLNNGVVAHRFETNINAVNFLTSIPNPTGTAPVLSSHRSADTNTGLTFGTKGTGVFSFNTNADGTPVTQLQVLHTSSAVNFLKLSGNSAGNTPIIKADGTDSNIGIAIQGKGSGTHSFYTDIGGAAPIQFQVLHTAAATRNITVTGSNGGNPTISATGGLVAFGVGISINGSAIFGNGIGISNTTPQNGGIAFPATQVAIADANTLDDYEEGTWTPSLGGNTTYTTQSGTYTKIGNLVFINASIVVNTIGTGSTSQVSGFPFTANGTNAFPLNIRVVTSSATAIVSAYAVLGASSTTAIVISRTAASTADAVNAIFGNNTQVQINGCYQV